ncbi:HAF family repeat protein [Chthonomonas calidirosea]|uniref:Probable extracellular repeat, HAF family n=1 Tax=Chthonomonas calidirosea (strain DSM 23976 / ICMP 18418 / T49) TaxID=1303518 RepID=S0EV08_CHTCT|nr:HAF repeat-containing protein [Chthonomonas calidirosea]CCW34182.1 probable extracellular repeat, HAF family [Chthonomonas calidirosea T49]CEK15525.1 HAF family repeat protein [Chthonomonas calidirosea]
MLRSKVLLILFLPILLVFQEPQEGIETPPHNLTNKIRYRVADLGLISTPTDNIGPAINQEGAVTGWHPAKLNEHPTAWLWHEGQLKILHGLPNYPDTYATALNDKLQVVGIARSAQDVRFMHPFLWEKESMHDLGGLGGSFGAALDINAQGDIVGFSQLASGFTHAFLYHNGKIRDLGTLPNGDFSIAEGINNKDAVVGISNNAPKAVSRAFVYVQGKMSDLGLLPGGSFSHAHAINDAGVVVGWANTADGDIHACLWKNHKIVDLGTLGDSPSTAWGINAQGQIVGSSADRYQHQHAFLWENGHMEDLNHCIPSNSGWILQRAFRINNRGQIVGIGRLDGETHVFLLTPLTTDTKADPAPNFQLKDTQGRLHTLRDYIHRPLALFFFCGCPWCQECARAWAAVQQSGKLPSTCLTLIVFTGSANDAKTFLQETQLDIKNTLLLSDPSMRVALLYKTPVCPRVFILNTEQQIIYTNDHAADAPQKATGITITLNAVQAIQQLTNKTSETH